MELFLLLSTQIIIKPTDNMKKMKSLFVASVCLIGISSCTLMHTAVVTNNPVGTKKYTMKKGIFAKDAGVSYNEAMKKGKITRLGVAEYKVTAVLFFVKQHFTVTGE